MKTRVHKRFYDIDGRIAVVTWRAASSLPNDYIEKRIQHALDRLVNG